MEQQIELIYSALNELHYPFTNNWPTPIQLSNPDGKVFQKYPQLQPFLLPSVSRIQIIEWLLSVNKLTILTTDVVKQRIQSMIFIRHH